MHFLYLTQHALFVRETGLLVFYFQNISNHMHFITNGYKRFLETNSSDPRQLKYFFERFSYVYQFILFCIMSKFSDHGQSPAGILGILFRVWQTHLSVRRYLGASHFCSWFCLVKFAVYSVVNPS